MKTILVVIFFLLEQSYQNQEQNPEQIADLKQSCPRCGSYHTIKNGSTHNGKPKRQCKDCGRQFVLNPNNQSVFVEIKRLIDKLLLERISLRGIARVTGVSFSWLQNYVNTKFSHVPRQVKVSEKSKGKLIIECDEMWSFVSSKANIAVFK
jgi:transposase-like protein